MKYQTEKPDYTNCHPGIAECLQRGEHPLCEVWDEKEKPESPARSHVRWYDPLLITPYMVGGIGFMHAEPIPRKTRKVKRASEIIMMLEDDGYVYGDNLTCYVHPYKDSAGIVRIHEIAGKKVLQNGDIEGTGWVCSNEDWIEEVEK